MELVANVWPVVDSGTGLVVRFMMRAYAMDASDAIISSTLRALAPTDFLFATNFRVPERFTVVSEHGSMGGCVTIGDFHQYHGEVLASAFQEIEASFTRLQGIGLSAETGEPFSIACIPRFPDDPYRVVTSLIELSDGRLLPHTSE